MLPASYRSPPVLTRRPYQHSSLSQTNQAKPYKTRHTLNKLCSVRYLEQRIQRRSLWIASPFCVWWEGRAPVAFEVIFLTLIFSTLILEVIHLNAHKHKRAHTHMHTRTRTRARTPQPLLLNAHTHASLFLRVGQNHTFLGKYGVHTVFLTGKSPYIHSHIRCSYTVLTNPTFCVLTWKDVKPDGPVPLSCHARNAIIIIVCTMCPPCQDCAAGIEYMYK